MTQTKGFKTNYKLRLGLSHLWFQNFKHSFQDTWSPICDCWAVETTIQYLLYCPNLSNERLFNTIQQTSKYWREDFKERQLQHFKSASQWILPSWSRKYFCFKSFNWIRNFNKTFWSSLISKLTLIYLSFCHEFFCWFYFI